MDAGSEGSIETTGLYHAGSDPGSATIRATDGGVTGAKTVPIVLNHAPTIATAASATVFGTPETAVSLSVLGDDAEGEAGLTYTWTATTKPDGANLLYTTNGNNGAKQTIAQLNRAGAYTFQVTASDGLLSATSSVNVTVDQTLTAITVTPGALHLNLNQTTPMSEVALDQFGQPLNTQPSVKWIIASGPGHVSDAGLFTSDQGAGGTVIAALGPGLYGTGTVTITDAPPTLAVAANAPADLITETSAGLFVLGADDGGESALTYTWSVAAAPSGAVVNFAENGDNAAKNMSITFNGSGTYTFMVVISDGTLTISSSVTLNVAPIGWYLNSNTGNDANDGLSPDQPVRTVAQLLTLPLRPGDTVYAGAGGMWRESLQLPVGVNIAEYGVGTLPLFDCSDVIEPGAWAAVGGLDSVFAAANLPVDWVAGGKTQHVNVYENGVQMNQVTDQFTCEVTPDSYYYAPLDSTTFTLLLHSSDGSNPASSGKVYEYSRRDFAVSTRGATATATDIWGRRNLGDDGSLLIGGPSNGIMATDGGKHNIYFAPGFVETDTVAFNACGDPGVICSMVVVNSNVAMGENTTFVDPIWGLDSLNADIYAFMHRNVSGEFGTLTITGGTITNVEIGIALDDFASLVMTGVTTIGCAEGVVVSDGNLTDELVITDCNLSASTRAVDVTGAVNCIIEQNAITVTGSAGFGIYTPGLSGSLTLLNNTITGVDAFAVGFGSNTSNTLQYNVYDTDVRFYYYDFVAGQPDNSDFNTFEFGFGSRFLIDENFLTFVQYQALTGQDAHSINGTT